MSILDRQILAAIRGAEADVQRLFVAEIRQQVRRVEQDCHPDSHTRWIDGREGAPVETVAPFGTALFEFRYLGDVLAFALDVLFANSPVDRHPEANNIVFRETRQLLVDGALVADVDQTDSPADLARLVQNARRGAEIVLTDTEPYARALENGWSPQAPSGVYRLSCATVRRKFGGIVTVDFRWIDGIGEGGRLPAMVIHEITS